MSLKRVFEEESEIPEQLKEFYIEQDGKWYLQMEDLEVLQRTIQRTRDDISKVKAELHEARKEADELRSQVEEREREIEEVKEKGTKGISEEIKAAEERTREKLRTQFEATIREKDKELEELSSSFDEATITNDFFREAGKAGLKPTAMDFVRFNLKDRIRVEEIEKNGKKVRQSYVVEPDGETRSLSPVRHAEPMTISELLGSIREEDGYRDYFEGPKSRGSADESVPGSGRLSGNNLRKSPEEIAEEEMALVQRYGVDYLPNRVGQNSS